MGIKPISVRSLNDDYSTPARPAISSSATDVCHVLTNTADAKCLPILTHWEDDYYLKICLIEIYRMTPSAEGVKTH